MKILTYVVILLETIMKILQKSQEKIKFKQYQKSFKTKWDNFITINLT